MSKQFFRATRFRKDSLRQIANAEQIITNYQGQGLTLTLRQLYYQFVTRNWITNTEKSYHKLSRLISDARLAGLLDWDGIEDRVRRPQTPADWTDPAAWLRSELSTYRVPRWDDQDHYAELWVEKDALAGVLWPLASEFHVTLMVNRGYASQSSMYDSAQRFIGNGAGRNLHLFYLGDHDPSGNDMVRDIRERLEMFGVPDLNVEKLALTMDQVREYDPPPNPAKVSDSRFAEYEREHGDQSWEVDALDPATLSGIIRDAFENILDRDLYDAQIAREDADKRRMRDAFANLDSGPATPPRPWWEGSQARAALKSAAEATAGAITRARGGK